MHFIGIPTFLSRKFSILLSHRLRKIQFLFDNFKLKVGGNLPFPQAGRRSLALVRVLNPKSSLKGIYSSYISMAGLAVGGWFASEFIAQLVDKLFNYIRDQHEYQKSEIPLMEKLEMRLTEILGVLHEADNRMVQNPSLNSWLLDLKDAALDADDVLDNFEYRLLLQEAEGESSSVSTCVDSLTFEDPYLNELNDLVKRLDRLVDSKETFHRLLDRAPEYNQAGYMQLSEKTSVPAEPILISQEWEKESSSEMPTSVPTKPNPIGRESKREELLGMLLSRVKGSWFRNKINIVPIVGIGGIGKTTLAQFIYNDSEVIQFFEKKAWVSVSNNFDVRNIMIKIIESAEIEKPSDFYQIQNEDVIQKILIAGLTEKEFLIILDDVWNEDKTRWEMLNASFKSGKEGSWVVVTTRNPKIAGMMRTVPIVELEGMGEEEFWIFFRKCAFGDAHLGDHPDLESLGREIAKKLRGNPLAAKTLGAVLKSKLEGRHWMEILNTKLCNIEQGTDDILPALQVSYMHLPVHLKQCFVYCSLFPKAFFFEKERVVLLWMAQGFITQTEKNKEKTLDSIGESYFDELLSRGFFQLSPSKYTSYVIHDLLHDLAQFVSNREYATVEDDNISSIPRRVLHLYIQGCNLQMAWKAICVKRRVRSLVIYGDFEVDILSNCLKELKGLRVLIINRKSMIRNFSDCFMQLTHLRYLELAGKLDKLPRSLCKLYHLQVLYMPRWLNQDTLIVPEEISKLSKLRYTNVRPEKFSRFGELRLLQEVPNYNVLKDSDHGISQLKDMNQIRGILTIQNLENVVNGQMASEANLSNKKHINFLTLVWNSQSHAKSEEVLEALQPHKDLERLEIQKYPGAKNPSWLETNWLSSIASVTLWNCLNLESLPSLGQLPLLRYLTLSHLDKITKIGAELYGVGTGEAVAFPLLCKLWIEDMPKLQEWGDIGSCQAAYPYLTFLCICRCPKFSSFRGPIVLPCSLKVLNLRVYDALYYGLPMNKSSLEIFISGKEFIREWFPVHNLFCLEKLIMPNNQLKNFPTEWFQQLYNVKQLQLLSCHNVYSMHDVVRSLPSLEVLSLLDCHDIILNDRDLHLKELHLEHSIYLICRRPYSWNLVVRCSNVQTITVDGSKYNVEDDLMIVHA